jgi:RNA polymerase sigma factor (sigma-70 family)
MKAESKSNDPGSKYAPFEITQWTVVQHAGFGASPEAQAALEALCRAYWQPLYCYIRRRGHTHEDAKDLTQSFFARLLDKNYLAAVDRRKGKFRNFLLASLEHFLANYWRDARAQKRGGGATFVSFDETFDQNFSDDAADVGYDADRVFEQQWAMAVLNQVLSRLRDEFTQKHGPGVFEDIKPALICEQTEASYAQIAARHNSTEAAIKMTVKRLRERYGQLLIAELANTVSTPDEIEDELRALFAALS